MKFHYMNWENKLGDGKELNLVAKKHFCAVRFLKN